MVKFKKKSDGHLIFLMSQDSEKAFEELYIRYKKRIDAFCKFLLKSPELSDDVVQDVFAMIWEKRKTINTHQSFSSFLYTVTRNKALNELRKESFRKRVDLETADQQALLVEEDIETKRTLAEFHRLLDEAITSLPERRRNIFLLSRKRGLTYKEIGKKLGISPHTVQAHISTSMSTIRSFMLRKANFLILIGLSLLCFS